jgi:ribonucleoside-diphosphate reductase alpha chain
MIEWVLQPFRYITSRFSNFHYLRPIWTQTTQKDALLGIGMTGIGSGKILEFDLKIAANTAKVVNSLISEKLELMKLLELLVLNLQEQLL